MCERYALASLDGRGLSGELARPRFNIAHAQDAPVAVMRDGAVVNVAMRWGMLAPWRGHGGKRPPMIYVAAADAIESTPLLRGAFRTQRCLVLADGFYAWRRTGTKSVPYWIHADGITAFAGLWTSRDDNRASFAIVIGPATGRIASITEHAPIVGDVRWLGEAARASLQPFADWRAEAVSTWVNAVEHDDARCLAPLGNPAQGELF